MNKRKYTGLGVNFSKTDKLWVKECENFICENTFIYDRSIEGTTPRYCGGQCNWSAKTKKQLTQEKGLEF